MNPTYWQREQARVNAGRQLEQVAQLHERDLAAGFGAVYLPEALDRKYPNAAREPAWQWTFPAEG